MTPRPEALAYVRRHLQTERDRWRDAADQVRPGLRSVALDRADAFSAMLAASSPPSRSSTSDAAGCRCSGASQCRQRNAPCCTSQPQTGHHEHTIMSALIVAYEAGPE